MLITLALALSLTGQDVAAEKLTYPDVALERDPLAPLPEGEEEEAVEVAGVSQVAGEAIADEAAAPGEAVAQAPAPIPTCPTRMFEAPMVLVGPGGRERATNVILCANSDDPQDYATMLRSARAKILFDENFTLASRSAFMEQVDAELATLDESADPSVEAQVPVGR